MALHHHVVEYPRPVPTLSARIGTVLINGSWFVRQLGPVANRVVVAHGHRHLDWVGTAAGVRVVSAPSPVMTRRDEPGHVNILTLAAGADGGLELAAPDRLGGAGRPSPGAVGGRPEVVRSPAPRRHEKTPTHTGRRLSDW